MSLDWIIYAAFFIAMLTLDFIVMRGRDVTIRRSLTMTGVYMASALSFGAYIYFQHGGIEPASEYLTIYGLEQMLSVDNLLVISLIFTYFKISKQKQHTALLYGIIGAIFFRGLFILSGGWLLQKFEWLLILFAAFLLYTGFKVIKGGDDSFVPEKNSLIQLVRKVIGSNANFVAAIVAIELCDIMFAVDSIPASFSVSDNSFVILTANLFAVLGLRSLYHTVSHGINLFEGIERYIGAVLMFLGAEIVFHKFFFEIPSWVTMAVVFSTLAIGVFQCRKQN